MGFKDYFDKYLENYIADNRRYWDSRLIGNFFELQSLVQNLREVHFFGYAKKKSLKIEKKFIPKLALKFENTGVENLDFEKDLIPKLNLKKAHQKHLKPVEIEKEYIPKVLVRKRRRRWKGKSTVFEGTNGFDVRKAKGYSLRSLALKKIDLEKEQSVSKDYERLRRSISHSLLVKPELEKIEIYQPKYTEDLLFRVYKESAKEVLLDYLGTKNRIAAFKKYFGIEFADWFFQQFYHSKNPAQSFDTLLTDIKIYVNECWARYRENARKERQKMDDVVARNLTAKDIDKLPDADRSYLTPDEIEYMNDNY